MAGLTKEQIFKICYFFFVIPGEEGRGAALHSWLQQLDDVFSWTSKLVNTLNLHTKVRKEVSSCPEQLAATAG
jgi:hypothetical protein